MTLAAVASQARWAQTRALVWAALMTLGLVATQAAWEQRLATMLVVPMTWGLLATLAQWDQEARTQAPKGVLEAQMRWVQVETRVKAGLTLAVELEEQMTLAHQAVLAMTQVPGLDLVVLEEPTTWALLLLKAAQAVVA